MPQFLFDSMRLTAQYHKKTWLCGCPSRKAVFCFPCLLFKFGQCPLSSNEGLRKANNFTNKTVKHQKTQSHISAVVALQMLGKFTSLLSLIED